MKYFEEGDSLDLNIKKIFEDDSRSKKRIGCNVSKRASRRGYVKGMKTQVDFLKGKQKKEYMKNGDVVVSNLYSDLINLPNKEELILMDEDKIRLILTEVIKSNSITSIYKKLGYRSCGGAYALFQKYKVNYQKDPARTKLKGIVRKPVDTENVAEHIHNETDLFIASSPNPLVASCIAPVNHEPVANTEEFTIKFNGVYDKAKIENRIVNMLTTLEDECEYEITFKLTEKIK